MQSPYNPRKLSELKPKIKNKRHPHSDPYDASGRPMLHSDGSIRKKK